MSASRTPVRVELVGVVEVRRVVHDDFGPEPAVAEVRPVADLAVADPHDVGQPVAADVGEVDRLGAVGERRAWGPFLRRRLAAPQRRGRIRPRPRHWCQISASSSMIIRSARPSPSRSTNRCRGRRVAVRRGTEGPEGLPALLVVVLVASPGRAGEVDQVEVSVAAEVHQPGRAGGVRVVTGTRSSGANSTDAGRSSGADVAA